MFALAREVLVPSFLRRQESRRSVGVKGAPNVRRRPIMRGALGALVGRRADGRSAHRWAVAWIPASAGMTDRAPTAPAEDLQHSCSVTSRPLPPSARADPAWSVPRRLIQRGMVLIRGVLERGVPDWAVDGGIVQSEGAGRAGRPRRRPWRCAAGCSRRRPGRRTARPGMATTLRPCASDALVRPVPARQGSRRSQDAGGQGQLPMFDGVVAVGLRWAVGDRAHGVGRSHGFLPTQE